MPPSPKIKRIMSGIASTSLIVIAFLAWFQFEQPNNSFEKKGTIVGLCEASSVIAWENGYLIGDNESETELFSFSNDFTPKKTLPLNTTIEDIEAITLIPDGLLVVPSLGANKKGKLKPNRRLILLLGNTPIVPDLTNCPICIEKSLIPPKEGGLSVEGAIWWSNSLYLGLRSPLIDNKAILLKMQGNPKESLSVEDMILVDLNGFGIRELTNYQNAIYILAGPTGKSEEKSVLYNLNSQFVPQKTGIDFPLSTEGIVMESDGIIYVTDGDGKPKTDCIVPSNWGKVPYPK